MKFIIIIFLLITLTTAVFCQSRTHSDEYYNLANYAITYLQDGDTNKSVNTLKSMANTYGEDKFIVTMYAINMLIGGETKEAKRVFNDILAKDPSNKFANYSLGIISVKEDNYKDASQYLSKVSKQVQDYNTLIEYLKNALDPNYVISNEKSDSFNTITLEAYNEIRNSNYEEAKKMLQLICDLKAYNSYKETKGILLSYNFNDPISFNGDKYKDTLGLTTPTSIKEKTLSGRITIKAEISKVKNASMLLFYIDETFKGMTNSYPSITIDTENYSNGLHDIRIDAIDRDNNIISSTYYTIDIFNKTTAPIFFDDDEMWKILWDYIQVKTGQDSINYLLAVCAAKTKDFTTHQIALERCVATNPEYKDAKSILKTNYFKSKGKKSVYSAPNKTRKRVAITFDDGPTKTTPELLDILDQYGAKGTFFIVGKMAEKNPDVIVSMAKGGHQVALHSENHVNLTRLDYLSLQKEVLQGYCAIKTSGITPSLYLRPPGGNINETINKLADDYGINTIMWTKNTTHLQQSSPEEMAEYCYNSLKPGYIYLLHNNEQVTTKALPLILSYFKEQGYECVTLEELLKP